MSAQHDRVVVPFERYPNLPPLFRRFLEGFPEFFPDPPTADAVERRGREILGTKPRARAEAFLVRGESGRAGVAALADGRAVAVVAGHQIGLFTGPLFTVTKAFDAIRVARELSARGVPAVPVFWALTDDHDLEEIAKTARPGRDKPEVFVLEGADRANRRPVGSVPLPENVGGILDAFATDARSPQAEEALAQMRRRYAAGATYGDAFRESLLDLAGDELVVLDPSHPSLRSAAAELFRAIYEKREAVRSALEEVSSRIERAGFERPVAFRPDVFPFFAVTRPAEKAGGDAAGVGGEERRRPDDPAAALDQFARGEAWASSDVLTRPLLKSWLLPVAATILGPSEIAYHAQSLALFPLFGLKPPVLLPRSFVIPLGPPERRAMEALGITKETLLQPDGEKAPVEVPGAAALGRAAADAERDLAALEPELAALDSTLVGALETTRRKVAYQIEQLGERMRKAAERKDETALARRRRLETLLLPEGAPAERLYPPLVPILAYGPGALEQIRDAALGSTEGAVVVDLGAPEPSPKSPNAVDVLAIAAHPDDVELTCAGTLVRLKQAGRSFGIVDLTAGEMGTRGDAATRERESRRSAEILGASFREALDFGDGGLRHDRDSELALIDVIRREKPRLVITSYPDDRHPDHRRAGELVRDASFYAGLRKLETGHPAHRPQQTIYFSTGYFQEPTFVVDVTATMERRREAMRAFSSQFHDPASKEPQTVLSRESFLEAIDARARHYGFMIGVDFGEGFVSRRPPRIDDPVAVFEGFEPGF